MNPIVPDMLAQEDGGGWTSLLYVLVVVILPMLSRLGAKIRKRFGGGEQESETLAPEAPSQAKLKRPSTKPNRVRPAADPAAVLTPQPTPVPPIPHARPPRLRPQPRAATVAPPPPPARPIEAKRRPRLAKSEKTAARPLQAQIATVLTERTDVPPERIEKTRKKRVAKKLRSAPPPAKTVPATLVVPNILTAKDLRAAVILSEILRPPLALREPDEF